MDYNPAMDQPPFLRTLDISGFKSFARPTRLEFPPGVTALVGPNGSGKSNVVDAIRWCLGEQNVRDLRGQRAEDVIYAGPRRVLGAAEVTLTFSVPGGGSRLPWSELAVSRRLYRSGESDYLLNRERVRLRDVAAGLHELGVGSVRHVVVTQGMADALLSATPAERRGLLEQAAGLAGYRERREDARHKLATTQSNIATIEAVLVELEPRVRLLRRQARAVVEREEAAERLRSRLRDWYASQCWSASQLIQDLSGHAAALAAQRRSAEEALRRLEEEAEGAMARERAWQQRVEAVAASLHGTERERDSAEHVLRQLTQRMADLQAQDRNLGARRERLHAARADVESRRQVAERELAALGEQRAEVDGCFRSYETEERSLRPSVERARREESACAAEHEQKRRAHAALTSRTTELEARLGALMQRLEETQGWLSEAATVEETLSEQVNERKRETTALAQRLADVTAQSTTVQESRQEAQYRLERIGRLQRRARAIFGDSRRTLAAAEKELAALQAEMEGGLLLGLDVAPGWEQAVAAALGEWALAAPGSPSLRLHFHDQVDFGRWRETLAGTLSTGLRWADDVVDGWPPGLLNPLLGTILAGSDEEADRLWRALAPLSGPTIGSPPLQIASRTGRCWNAVGIRSSRPDNGAAAFLDCRRRLLDHRRREATSQRRLESLDQARHASEAAVEQLRSREQALAHAEQTTSRALSEQKAALVPVERRLNEHRAEWESRTLELTQTRRTIDGLQRELAGVREMTGQVAADVVGAAQRWAAAREAARQESDRLADSTQRKDQARQRSEILAARYEAQQQLVQAILGDEQRLQTEADGFQEDVLRREHMAAAVQREMEEQHARLRELQAAAAEQEQRLAAVRQERPVAGGNGKVARAARERLAQIIAQHEQALAALAQAEGELRRLRTEASCELDGHPGDLNVQVIDPPGDDEIRRLRARAAQYADADPAVVNEARELGERQESLRAHVADLAAASNNLRNIMTVTDREMRQRFHAAVTTVGTEFARVFGLMLRGGDARLEQVDDDGVEIRVTLPGRRSRSSAAFSGGERSLVATALLFGVLKTRPSPFCILDEVDAALDESNVDRYLAVLRELSEHTQMIVVTHQRATMAAADVLYGMTLDDEGVSTPLSLRLDAYGVAG